RSWEELEPALVASWVHVGGRLAVRGGSKSELVAPLHAVVLEASRAGATVATFGTVELGLFVDPQLPILAVLHGEGEAWLLQIHALALSGQSIFRTSSLSLPLPPPASRPKPPAMTTSVEQPSTRNLVHLHRSRKRDASVSDHKTGWRVSQESASFQ